MFVSQGSSSQTCVNIKHNKTYEYVKSPRAWIKMAIGYHTAIGLSLPARKSKELSNSKRAIFVRASKIAQIARRRGLGEVKWVISHKLGQKLGFPMDSWIDFEDMTVKFERFLQWWVIIGCTLITGCWANLFSVKTHVSNMQGGQVDYHGTMAVPHLGSQSHGFDWILGFLAPPNPMVYRGVSSRFPVKLPFYTPTVTNGYQCNMSYLQPR